MAAMFAATYPDRVSALVLGGLWLRALAGQPETLTPDPRVAEILSAKIEAGACAISDTVRELGIEIRAGLHTGEVERRDQAVTGLAVHVGARVAALAGASEVLVTSTVQTLVLGSGIGFADRGSHSLKGVPERWHLFAVERA
jgi:class 3 adenylate cyclase